jgi:hypothetical protein
VPILCNADGIILHFYNVLLWWFGVAVLLGDTGVTSSYPYISMIMTPAFGFGYFVLRLRRDPKDTVNYVFAALYIGFTAMFVASNTIS